MWTIELGSDALLVARVADGEEVRVKELTQKAQQLPKITA